MPDSSLTSTFSSIEGELKVGKFSIHKDALVEAFRLRNLAEPDVRPLPDLPISQFSPVGDSNRDRYATIGNEALRNGEVALFCMAGGMATRLGSSVPKGMFPLPQDEDQPFSCLFEVLIHTAISVYSHAQESPEEEEGPMDTGILPPLVLLFSPQNKEASIQFLRDHSFFGYPQEKLHFLVQGVYPSLTPSGDTLPASQDGRVVSNPNGNGGALFALIESGLLDTFRAQGIQYLHLFGVDNPLTEPAEPCMVGFAKEAGLLAVNKVTARRSITETVGIVGLRGVDAGWQVPNQPDRPSIRIPGLATLPGLAPSVLEYSERESAAPGAFDGPQMANLANHLFSVDWLRLISASLPTPFLPLHLAWKKVGYMGPGGEMVTPEEPNAWKIEHFIFDVFHYCALDKFGVYVVDRKVEFSPLKRAVGPDSLATCLADLKAKIRRQRSAVKE
eukprot:gnl/Dysnectes_brevis/2201_a2565_919.p1 GENE.gnl/Dysnectes_brevis/2201_a2565_919~~gnl/Dysnectes_brevis/2201_a2565_919.p1  ORF type:complete len:446 (+),score=140.53 gnl/Dysnectes_brevis/2201_a2565_919:72-1409(+)